VRALTAERAARATGEMPSDVDAKRQAAIDKKEVERKAKNEEIKAKKAEMQRQRDKAKASGDEEAAAAKKKQDEVNAKREANIKDRESKRNQNQKSKYSKSDVMLLKNIFDEYDKDNSGHISVEEFQNALRNKKRGPRPGEKSTLAERQAAQGISILDISESVFTEMDKDGDGQVTFEEMLKITFRLASPNEIGIMLKWVEKEPEPEPEPKATLSAEAVKQIKSIFKLYDKDRNGSLTKKELKEALSKTGLDVDEMNKFIKEFDSDENGEINQEEFLKLMDSTGAFEDD